MTLLAALRDAGATLRLEGDDIRLGNASRVPPPLMERARAERDALVEALRIEADALAKILALCVADSRNPFYEGLYDHVRAFQRGEIDRHRILAYSRPLGEALRGETLLKGRDLREKVREVFPAPVVAPVPSLFGPRPDVPAFGPAAPGQEALL